MNSLFQLVSVNFKTFYREPAIIFWSTIFPILMAWVLGVAFSGKNETVRTVYVIGKGIPEIEGVALAQFYPLTLASYGHADFIGRLIPM